MFDYLSDKIQGFLSNPKTGIPTTAVVWTTSTITAEKALTYISICFVAIQIITVLPKLFNSISVMYNKVRTLLWK